MNKKRLQLVLPFLMVIGTTSQDLGVGFSYLKLSKSDSLGYPSTTFWALGDFGQNSNAVPNSFVLDFSNKSFIDEASKNKVSPRLKNKNKLGAAMETEVGVRSKINSENFLTVKYVYKDHTSLLFNKDLFELVFRGNKVFEGKTANLSETKVVSMGYQTVSLGLDHISPNNRVNYGFDIGLTGGTRWQQLYLANTSLYTGTQGTELILPIKGEYAFTERGRPIKGWGTSSGLWGMAVLNEKKRVYAHVKDLGFIHWTGLSHYQKDSTFNFSGVQIDDLFNLSDDLFSNTKENKLQDLLRLKKTKRNFTQILPFSIALHYQHDLNSSLKWQSGVDYIYLEGYLPKLYSGLVYEKSNWVANGSVSLGGFGGIDWKIGGGYSTPRFTIITNLHLLEMLIAPSATSGYGASVGIITKF